MMSVTPRYAFAALLLGLLLAMQNATAHAARVVSDMAGRTLHVPERITRTATIGMGPVLDSFIAALGVGDTLINGMPVSARLRQRDCCRYLPRVLPGLLELPPLENTSFQVDQERLIQLQPEIILTSATALTHVAGNNASRAFVVQLVHERQANNVAVMQALSELYGVPERATDYHSADSEVRGLAGYWFHVQEPPGPPTDMAVQHITSNGSLSFAGWSTLAKMSNHIFNSPYAGLQGTSGPWSWDAAMRYMNYHTPAITYYNGAGLAASSYDGAFSQNPPTTPDRAATSRRLTSWLPNVGVSYRFTPQIKGYMNLGRNYGPPAFGIATAYNAARAQFVAAGASLQSMMSKADQELSDNFDIGLHLTGKSGYLSPVLYDTRYRNRAVQIVDPDFGVTYSQNSGKAHARGLELEGGWYVTPQLTAFGGFSVSKFELTKDTQAASGVWLTTAGKRVADSPSFMAKLGLSYRHGGWTWTPTVRHIASRYGNALNTECAPGV